VCVQQNGQLDQFKWELNADSSKPVKATDFKLDTRFQVQPGHDPLIFLEKGASVKIHLAGDMHSNERLLVIKAALLLIASKQFDDAMNSL